MVYFAQVKEAKAFFQNQGISLNQVEFDPLWFVYESISQKRRDCPDGQSLKEATPGLEPGNRAFAEPSLTNLGKSPKHVKFS